MARRYWFGPTNRPFVDNCLAGPRQAGACIAFDEAGATNLAIRPGDTWDDVIARVPEERRPDFLALYPAYMAVPAGLWQAPVPIVVLAADWNLLWHQYRTELRQADLILTDPAGVEAFRREGFAQVREAPLYGCQKFFLEHAWPETSRDIDILFVGNLHPATQAERLSWLGQLAPLGRRWKVAIHSGVFGDDYRKLLARARIVFNRSVRGECNLRVFEAAAAGALLFQEADNREVFRYFRDRQECVAYTAETLTDLLEHYLEHEDERRAIAEAARERVPDYSFEKLWQKIVEEVIETEWDQLVESSRRRATVSPQQLLLARTAQFVSRAEGSDPALAADLATALAAKPADASLHNALGLTLARTGRGGPLTVAAAEQALGYFQRAVQTEPAHVVAGLNLTECLAAVGQRQPAFEQVRRTLSVLNARPRLDEAELASSHFPPAFDHFRVEWEKAAWANAGNAAAEDQAKQTLLRWRLHFLLGELTGEIAHYYEAALARPDLPITRGMLGCALGRANRPTDAVPHLQQAVADNPFDLVAARALFQALADSGDITAKRRLARDRRLLSQAAPGAVPTESWFQDAAPVGDELTSILILCCNQLACTRQCLDSVVRHTRAPYELIIVDNASTDATPAYLEELRSQPGPARVHVIRNETNRGFPAGCNQALAEARGDYVVFLNNDVIVTKGWLDGLIGWALHDWPKVGMVGPVTNYTRPPQQIAVDYTDVAGIDAFAARRRQEFAGKALAVERLTGFCLLARREVLQTIGGFDEQYGLGFFDDDDLCVRALQAGLRLLVVPSVFVHHFGSRTFTGLGIDCREQLQNNFDRFKAKWGEQHAAGYRMPDLVPGAAPAAEEPTAHVVDQVARSLAAHPAGLATHRPYVRYPRATLCMIVKNEEKNLADCLAGAADLFEDIVVVDTGSTDMTKPIAERFGARVFDFPWVDSFAAARNETLRHARGDWIFWLDADDRLDEANRHKLRAVLANLPTGQMVAYSMKCACLPDPQHQTVTVVDHIRLFPNHGDVRWKYRVHEQILPSIRQLGGQVRFADVVIQHTGYQDPALRGRKLERDLRLLHLENQEQPDDPFTLFNLGSVYQELGKQTEALPLLRRSLERSQPQDSIVRKLYALIAQGHRQLGQPAEALAACQQGRQLYPDDAELLFHEAQLRREQRDLAGAESCFVRLLTTQDAAHFASVDAGLRGYKARYNLAVVYYEMGRWPEAEVQWKQTLAEHPNFAPAELGLGELYLAQNRLDEAARQYQRTLQLLPTEAYAHARQGEVLLLQGRLAEATACFREALRLQPGYAAAHSSLLMCLNYDPETTPQQLLTEHEAWAERHGQGPVLDPLIDHDRSTDRRLRVGYVSPNLHRHVVARFLEPILANHDRETEEVFCYADGQHPEAVRQRWQASGVTWRPIAGITDGQVAAQIRADRVDILVDLAGHTGNRLGVFAHKPVPVQVTYLGYPGTTGLNTIDYRLTDAIADPLDEPNCGSEELVRLPAGFCCYQPPLDVPEVGPLPAIRNDYITFGGLHHLAKLNDRVLDRWCAVLQASPTAKLLLARHTLVGTASDRLREEFRRRGIADERLLLRVAPTDGQHWQIYNDIDIALDTLPWSGHTTACEALWMGVPVVTMTGDRYAGRMVTSVLARLELADLVAGTSEDFVAKAVQLATHADRLADLRARLRERMRQSPLCDGPGFTRHLEQAYRQMWQRWVDPPVPTDGHSQEQPVAVVNEP